MNVNNLTRYIALFVCIASASFVAAQDGSENVLDAHVWDQVRKPLEQALVIQDEYPTLDDSKWFSRDKKNADKELLELYDSVIDALQISGLRDLCERNKQLNRDIRRARAKVVEYKEQMVTAPDETSLLSFKATKEKLEKDIAETQAFVDNAQEEQRQLAKQIVDLFKTNGMYITEDQAKLYLSLSMINDKGLLSLYSIFFNVQQVSRQVAEQIRTGEGDPVIIKRYYGMYVVLSKAMLLAYQRVLDTIDNVYLERIYDLREQAAATMDVTRNLMQREGLSDQQRSVLNGNYQAQQRFIEMCNQTEKYLLKLQKRLDRQLDKLTTNYEIAENTYMTAWVGAVLLETIDKFSSDVTELQTMKLDPVIPLNDQAVMQYFDDFAVRLGDVSATQ